MKIRRVSLKDLRLGASWLGTYRALLLVDDEEGDGSAHHDDDGDHDADDEPGAVVDRGRRWRHQLVDSVVRELREGRLQRVVRLDEPSVVRVGAERVVQSNAGRDGQKRRVPRESGRTVGDCGSVNEGGNRRHGR